MEPVTSARVTLMRNPPVCMSLLALWGQAEQLAAGMEPVPPRMRPGAGFDRTPPPP